jgi:flagellar motor switch protein FliM
VHQNDGAKKQHNRDSISAYDFRTPVFLSPIELRKLRIHHEEFIQALAARLSIYLRVEFSLQMSQLHTLPYGKWCESLNSPTHITLYRVEPLRGICLLDIPPRLGLTIVDRLLGGPGHSISGNRDLSELEVTLLDQVISLMLTEWCTHWAKYRDLRPSMFGHESNGRFLQTADTDAIMLVLAFEAQMGDCLETIQMAFPYATVDPVVRQLSTRLKPTKEDEPEVGRKPGVRWHPQYDDARIHVSAEWNGLRLRAREVAGLAVGDVIPLPVAFADEVAVKLASKPRFSARLGTSDGRWAVEIVSARLPPKPESP